MATRTPIRGAMLLATLLVFSAGRADAQASHGVARVEDATAPSPLVASVLPGARSVELGASPTVFANILNLGSSAVSNCLIALPTSAPMGLTLAYQTTDPSTNAPIGTPNTPVTIPAAPTGSFSAQTFILTFSATAAFTQPALPLQFACDGVAPVATITGVNTVDLSFSATPVPDVITLSATADGDGIVQVPLVGTGAFALATANIGAAANLTAMVDMGAAILPITTTICQTMANGQCLAAPTASLPVTIAAGATPTFSVFVTASNLIALAPATSRIFVRFLDSGGVSHGATSVAVETLIKPT